MITRNESDELPIEFLGKPVRYWIELERLAKTHNLEKTIDELVDVKNRLIFYELVLDRINCIANTEYKGTFVKK